MLFAQRDYHRDQYMTGDLAEKQATSRDRTTSTTTKGRLPTRQLSADITHLLSSVLSRTEPHTTFSICLACTGSWAYRRPWRTQYRARDFVTVSRLHPPPPHRTSLVSAPFLPREQRRIVPRCPGLSIRRLSSASVKRAQRSANL